MGALPVHCQERFILSGCARERSDDGKGKGNGAAMSAAKGVLLRPAPRGPMTLQLTLTLLDNNIIFFIKGRGLGRGVVPGLRRVLAWADFRNRRHSRTRMQTIGPLGLRYGGHFGGVTVAVTVSVDADDDVDPTLSPSASTLMLMSILTVLESSWKCPWRSIWRSNCSSELI